MFLLLLVFAVLFLSYWNGANDNFKGVATLYGSSTVDYRTAITIATLATFAGSIAALFLAQNLVNAFSGKGLVPDDSTLDIQFLISVATGASLTVLLATKIGLPVSTTHSLIGGLLGGGLASVGSQVNFTQLVSVFFLPLLFSPFLAAGLTLVVYGVLTEVRRRSGIRKELCLCIGQKRQMLATLLPSAGFAEVQSHSQSHSHSSLMNLNVTIAEPVYCQELYTGSFAGISIQKLLDMAHMGSAAMVSFARGLNDTPKIAGLLVASVILDIDLGLVAIAIAMAIGGLINARKVAETISHKITRQTHGQGFVANLVTGMLVILASRFGLPVSTTHVSVGALFGISLVSGKRNTRVICDILLAWLATLPIAIMLSAGTYWLLAQIIV